MPIVDWPAFALTLPPPWRITGGRGRTSVRICVVGKIATSVQITQLDEEGLIAGHGRTALCSAY